MLWAIFLGSTHTPILMVGMIWALQVTFRIYFAVTVVLGVRYVEMVVNLGFGAQMEFATEISSLGGRWMLGIVMERRFRPLYAVNQKSSDSRYEAEDEQI